MRRLHLRLDEARYQRVVGAARRRRTSMASVIREAIDEALPDEAEKKRAAAEAILAAEPSPVPANVAELKREISEAHSRHLLGRV